MRFLILFLSTILFSLPAFAGDDLTASDGWSVV